MDRADLELFERSLEHATATHTGGALDLALAELGWHDALAIDPGAAVSTLFRLQGTANATSSALGRVLLVTLGIEDPAAGVVLPALGRWGPPGEVDGGRLRVRGLGLGALDGGDTVLVVAESGGTEAAVAVKTPDLTVRHVRGVDPSLGVVEIEADDVPVDDEGSPAVAGWPVAVSLCQLAVGHELAGASRRMLELARQHALDRIQFGRPIATFQAVRHRLAETLIAIETAEAVLSAAWEDRSPQTAAMAKALAGRGARTAARHCQQVLAGIGFTTEHPLHRYVRRVLVLDELFGASRTLTKQLGEELLASRKLPTLLPL